MCSLLLPLFLVFGVGGGGGEVVVVGGGGRGGGGARLRTFGHGPSSCFLQRRQLLRTVHRIFINKQQWTRNQNRPRDP